MEKLHVLSLTGGLFRPWRRLACILAAAAVVVPAQAGTIIGGEVVGVNFNNKYLDNDTKTDWQGFSFDSGDNTFSKALADLSNTVSGGYGNLRLGFSRNMAADPTDLNQWLDDVELAINAGYKVMVAGWFQGDVSDELAVTDAVLWQNVLGELNTRDLMHGISGFELQNEPASSADGWKSYVRKVWKNVGPHGSQGWNALDATERAETAAAWYDKPIVVQGNTFGQQFSATLVDGLDGLNNLVWSAHDYPRFASDITPERENWTVEQWYDHYINKWTDRQSRLNGNIIVTEIGTNNFIPTLLSGMGPAGTVADDRRDSGFMIASRDYYGQGDTTVFWYTAYHGGPIGVGGTGDGTWRYHGIDATNYFFSGGFAPTIPEGTSNVALGKTATADSTASGYNPAFAVDGVDRNSVSRWLSDNNNGDHWLQIDLDGLFEISEARIYTGFDKYEQAISEFTLQRFFNGQWLDIISLTDNNNPALILGFDPVLAEQFRLWVPAGADNLVKLFELELYGIEVPPLEGDFDGDGFVGINDLNMVLSFWNQSFPRGSPPFDANNDGFIGIDDLNVVLSNWNLGTPPGNLALPEPASAGILGVCSLWLMRRR